jgi:hypothetical protein
MFIKIDRHGTKGTKGTLNERIFDSSVGWIEIKITERINETPTSNIKVIT